MAYTISDKIPGLLPIANTDAGTTFASGSTTYPTPPLRPGMIVGGQDPTYGGAEFILLAGVAGTAVGSVVYYNTTNYTTTLAPAGTNLPRPIAVAMSANTSSSTWGWYQISGVAVALKTASSMDADVAVGLSATAGRLGASATGNEIQGLLTTGATATAAATTIQVVMNRPHMMGRIT